ncbi:hypothetical protein V8B55DRAFT_1345902 [Mucor lusitanicus]|uniref:Reverse transcriptase zinc-binding domain-containing protein n=2 Tax=Mucor circinelloides f. lusitanicus TaxID=29924 RepID=A0A168GFE0_MUCCL|nr:hypothetical protein FB192DRAFT_1476309 [Mucor lusitanicus]OAC97635.1 hypothetical protein MUCCIDRAFT_168317 [Mucor lusitanicus CBS 277.49]
MDDLADSLAALFTNTTHPAPPPSVPSTSGNPIQYKILAYADDTLVYLKDTTDFLLLKEAIHNLGSSFINFRIFPKLSFRTLQQPRHHGGLQVLDPILQQQALQWRWLCPLILSACRSPLLPTYNTPNLPLLQFTLQWFFNSSSFSDYFYYLLFPAARKVIWFQHRPSPHQAFLNTLNSLITAVDRLPRSFTTCHLDSHTGLSLPLLEIILYSLPSTHPHFSSFIPPDQLFDRHPGVQKLLAIDVFTFDFDLQVIRVRNWSSLEFTRYPRVSRRVGRLIEEGQIYLQPFFLALCRPAPRPSFTNDSFTANPPNIRPLIRRLIQPTTPLPPQQPLNSIQAYKALVSSDTPSLNISPLSSSQWRLFWQLPILLQSRTVWYRLLHRKIPSKSILHHLIPNNHPSPQCPLCSSQGIEDIQHFFFTCPLKLAVW